MFTYKIDDNIHLELLQQVHFDGLLNVLKRNQKDLGKWMSWIGTTCSIGDYQKFMNRMLSRNVKGLDIHSIIFYNNIIVGGICLTDIDKTNKKADAGYWLDFAYRKRGVITKVLPHMIEYAFFSLKLNRVNIVCSVVNSDSNKVPQRLGFRPEATLKEWELVNGEPHDFNIYGITKTAWEKKHTLKYSENFKYAIVKG
ncbi:GNAT family N-acetyltransferase [Proteinivorax hydrogeniformans]|uniref:GNAT family N-acetyltransferase n=1 Tax=Proteinivorax hydrogeniformans TaxID=1826727 RepID=A0AAU8HTZ2_9FIRM